MLAVPVVMAVGTAAGDVNVTGAAAALARWQCHLARLAAALAEHLRKPKELVACINGVQQHSKI